MTLVVDASVAVRWMFQLDRSDRAAAVVQSGERLTAPDLIMAEIANAAWKLIIFGGAPTDMVQLHLRAVEKTFDGLVSSVELKDRALAIALELRHAAYDCFYLALAELRNCHLITADDRLLRRCADTPFAKMVRAL